jgi:hypothetical protein
MFEPVYSAKIELRNSAIHGKGTFAKVPINKGEILFVKSGHILHTSKRNVSSVLDCDWPLNDGFILGAQTDEERDMVRLLINHSCKPNCGLAGLNAGIAIRDIEADEEITFDYAMLDNEDYRFNCHCGSNVCRKSITGFDWKMPELQKQYKGCFSLYIQEKIDKQNEKQGTNS